MASKRENKSTSKSKKLSFIVRNLSEKLKRPTPLLPSVEWMSESCIKHLLIDVRDEFHLPRSDTGKELLNMLIESGLAKELEIKDVPLGKDPHIVYCLEFGGRPEISPAELLLSTQSDFSKTAICYFTAIQHHELSSQIPSHHHIAKLKPMSRLSEKERLAFLKKQDNNPNTRDIKNPSLGTLLFHYEDTPYFETSRDRNLVPGVQEVLLRPSLLARVTTLEQTLLDTLHKPWSCGGPAVVFEAWENGVALIDEETLLSYLNTINRFDVDLRVGYMLSQFHPSLEKTELTNRFKLAKEYVTSNNILSLSLLPDVPCNTYNDEWRMHV